MRHAFHFTFLSVFLPVLAAADASSHEPSGKAPPEVRGTVPESKPPRPGALLARSEVPETEEEKQIKQLRDDKELLKNIIETKKKNPEAVLKLKKRIGKILNVPVDTQEDLQLQTDHNGSALFENKGDNGIIVRFKHGDRTDLIVLRLDRGKRIDIPDAGKDVAFVGRYFQTPAGWTVLRHSYNNDAKEWQLKGAFFPANGEREGLVSRSIPRGLEGTAAGAGVVPYFFQYESDRKQGRDDRAFGLRFDTATRDVQPEGFAATLKSGQWNSGKDWAPSQYFPGLAK